MAGWFELMRSLLPVYRFTFSWGLETAEWPGLVVVARRTKARVTSIQDALFNPPTTCLLCPYLPYVGVEFIGQKHPSFGEEATSKLNLNAPGWSSVAAWLDSVPSEKTQRNYETMFGIFWEYATENHFRGFIDSPDALVSHRFKESKLDAEDPASFYS